MSYTVIAYTLYLLFSIALTIWVARTLTRFGQTFLIDIFKGNSELARSVNKLLEVGFYLINLGYIFYVLKIYSTVSNAEYLIEVLSYKLGGIALFLGAIHFLNLVILFRLKSRAHLY